MELSAGYGVASFGMVNLSPDTIKKFQASAYSHYSTKRDGEPMPWRIDPSPYKVLVSEFMLQQTQVSRVIEKFRAFIAAFPTITQLAEADFRTVLRYWQGLGYNRRAKYLHNCAQQICIKHNGIIPSDEELLKELSGIGSYTAGAIGAFAFNKAVLFIDTNIRRVYIHYFFSQHDQNIADTQIHALNKQCLDYHSPRNWYGALMDWGAYLGRQMKQNPNKKSKHYTRQTSFHGSIRQVRGTILRLLTQHPSLSYDELHEQSMRNKTEFSGVLSALQKEGFIVCEKGHYSIRLE